MKQEGNGLMSELNEREKLLAVYEYSHGKTVREVAKIIITHRQMMNIEEIESSVAWCCFISK